MSTSTILPQFQDVSVDLLSAFDKKRGKSRRPRGWNHGTGIYTVETKRGEQLRKKHGWFSVTNYPAHGYCVPFDDDDDG